MTAEAVLAALALPAAARVGKRVPKKLLLEHGAHTAADRRQINEGIEELHWVAALKPTTIAVPEYRDAVREYLELAVLRLTLRADAKAVRLVELVHRAIPYPVLLVLEQGARIEISAVHKRWAQNEAGKVVLDGEIIAAAFQTEGGGDHAAAFLGAMALCQLPRGSLQGLYQGWLDVLLTWQASQLTGVWRPTSDPLATSARREALRACARLEFEIALVHAAARVEKQIARQVELNLELKRLQAAMHAARSQL